MTEFPEKAQELEFWALEYFYAAHGYFWRWAEEQEVVEWQNGVTICYRAELQQLLIDLAPNGLLPLGSILLVLSACTSAWTDASGAAVLERLQREVGGGSDGSSDLRQAVALLEAVALLPTELRTGPAKLHLLRELSNDDDGEVLAVAAAGPGVNHGQQVIDEWSSGRLQASLTAHPAPAADLSPELRVALEHDLLPLMVQWKRIADDNAGAASHKLAVLLRSGLLAPPAPLPALPTPTPEPEAPADLLTQLSQDPRTYGLARLTQRLVAALRIPPHSRDAGEQPLGGVADITNRGNFDRLLLSELAHDDLPLLARLAGNEALYLRREAPPVRDLRPRLILLDTTLRLWGVPRVFGLAAALAWARQPQPGGLAAPAAAYALGGEQAEPLDLASFDGAVDALGRLDPAPHAGAALTAFARTPAAAAADCLLITDAQLLHQPAFVAALAEARPALRFLLTVDRSGELQLYEYGPSGQRTLLGLSRHDLDELLFAAMPAPPPRPGRPGEPAYLAQQPAPLFYPTTGLKVTPKTSFYRRELGLLGISEQRRVLFYPSREFGAQELLPHIEPGQYHFGHEAAALFVLVEAEGLLVFYAFDTVSGAVERVELAEEYPPAQPLTAVSYLAGCFYLCFGRSPSIAVTVFDCRRRHVVTRHAGPFPSPASRAPHVERGQLKQHVNNGYSVVQNVRLLGLSPTGELTMDGWGLHLAQRTDQSCYLKLRPLYPDESPRHRVGRGQGTNLLGNPLLWLGDFTWPDGSRAWVDSRGLLHLRSADATVPDITVLLVVHRTTAAWAADGTVCGPDYFTGPQPPRRIDPAAFYQQYIQRFIDCLPK